MNYYPPSPTRSRAHPPTRRRASILSDKENRSCKPERFVVRRSAKAGKAV